MGRGGKTRVSLIAMAAALLLGSAPASAWMAPHVGTPCRGLRGDGHPVTAVQGNFYGAKATRGFNSDRDVRSFQHCFRTLAACERWMADKARAFPLPPRRSTCTTVVLR